MGFLYYLGAMAVIVLPAVLSVLVGKLAFEYLADKSDWIFIVALIWLMVIVPATVMWARDLLRSVG